jgi:hypothetical protein
LLESFQRHLGLRGAADVRGFDKALDLDDRGWVKFGDPKGSELWQILSPVRMHPHGVHDLNRWIQLQFRAKEVDAAPPTPALDPVPVDAADPEPVDLPVPAPAWDPPPARRRRWSELKTAALVGTGVLAFLIAIGTLGRGNATPQAANGAAAAVPSSPATDRPASLAAEASAPGPAASPSTQASATTRPPRTKTPTATATAKPAVLAAKIETDPATYRGPCTTTGLEIEVTLTITANQPGTRFTYTSTGRGTRTATTTGSTYTTTYRVRLDNSHRDTHTFTLNVTSPSPVSAQATVEDYCTRA